MRTAGWYVRRLQRMTAAEVAWRTRSALRDARDRCSLAIGRLPRTGAATAGPLLRSSLCGAPAGSGAPYSVALLSRADRLVERRLTFSSLDAVFVGEPVDWNRDHESGLRTPMGFSNAIDYRNPSVAGDAKLVWDLNRHQHLPVLGRAYRASGELRYARAGLDDIASWIEQCPFGHGMNWRSPLELAIRAINWIWFLDLIAPSGMPDLDARERIRRALELHVFDIARKYSRGSSANNHLIGEAAGVFIATSMLPYLPDATARRDESRQLLEHEIVAQTNEDGGSAEHAFGYHMFAFEFFLLAGIVARRTAADFTPDYWSRLARMVDFADAFCAAGSPPLFGDYDDGFVLDLAGRAPHVPALLALGAAWSGHTLHSTFAADCGEPLHWAPPPGNTSAAPAVPVQKGHAPLSSRAFESSGYYLLQWEGVHPQDRVSVFFDCATLGFGSIAAHGHADALHFTVRAFGEEAFVDPGTYDYFRHLEWRDYFRSTRGHNTVSIDGLDQSVMHGSFLWGARAAARRGEWNPSSEGGVVSGEHDGYMRLPDPVRHRRRLVLDRATRSLLITDDMIMHGSHQVRVHFHLSEHASVQRASDSTFVIGLRGGALSLHLDPRLSVASATGAGPLTGGWVSRRYHHRVASTVVTATLQASAPTTLVSRIVFGDPK